VLEHGDRVGELIPQAPAIRARHELYAGTITSLTGDALIELLGPAGE